MNKSLVESWKEIVGIQDLWNDGGGAVHIFMDEYDNQR